MCPGMDPKIYGAYTEIKSGNNSQRKSQAYQRRGIRCRSRKQQQQNNIDTQYN
jgi:hypothetical protein